MFKLFRKSEPVQEILHVCSDDIHVQDRLLWDDTVVEVVAKWLTFNTVRVIIRPVVEHSGCVVTLDEYRQEDLFFEQIVQVTRFK